MRSKPFKLHKAKLELTKKRQLAIIEIHNRENKQHFNFCWKDAENSKLLKSLRKKKEINGMVRWAVRGS